MAVVQFGALVTGIKGKVGGQVFQGGRTGTIFKNKGNRGGSGSSERVKLLNSIVPVNRINFAIVTKHWSSLTDGERNSWAALIGVWTFTNKFGDVYNGTAYQIFVAVNLNRLSLNLAIFDTAEVKVDAEDPVWSLSDYSLSGNWDLSRTLVPAVEQNFVISFTRPQNETKNIGSIIFNKAGTDSFVGAGTSNLKAFYNLLYGYQPPLGSFVYMHLWTCIASYPRQQFITTLKSEVVA